MNTITKATLVLKDGVGAAMERLQGVRQRRSKVETIIIRNEGDDNDSGWSTSSSEEENSHDKNPSAVASATGPVVMRAAAEATLITESEFQRLFQAIGQINELKHLLIDYYTNPIPIKALMELFRQSQNIRVGSEGVRDICQKIESLEFRHVRFIGKSEDFQSFAKALITTDPPIINIKVCLLISCRTVRTNDTIGEASNGNNNSLLIDSFLSSLTNLQEVTLEEMDVSTESLANLVSNLPRLCTMQLRHVPAADDPSRLLADALRENSRELKTIQIRYALCPQAASPFFRMLQDHPSLETVDIDINCNSSLRGDDDDDDCEDQGYGKPLGAVLQTNQHLKDFEMNIFGDDKYVEENALAIAKALGDNDSLRRLCLTYQLPLLRQEEETHDDGVDGNDDDQSSMEEMMKGRLNHAFVEPIAAIMPDNFALCELLVGSVHERVIFCHRTRFYLKLNQAGRKELLEPNEASRKQWVETLITNRDDLDVIFYLLPMNPHLTEHPTYQADLISVDSSVIRTKRLKRE